MYTDPAQLSGDVLRIGDYKPKSVHPDAPFTALGPSKL